MKQFIAQLFDFIEKEFDAQQKQRRKLWRQSIDRRVAAGLAIDNITITEFDRDSATLKLMDNVAQFGVGDPLRLSLDDPEGDYIGCVLEHEEGAELTVSPGYLQTFRKLKRSPGWTLDVDIIDRRQPLLTALDTLGALSAPNARQLARTLGGAKPEIDRAREAQAQQYAARTRLEVNQREALIRGRSVTNYWVVEGAPTTGKTHVLAELAAVLAREGQRVFITGPDDLSVNHALRAVLAQTGHKLVRKIGDPRRTEGLAEGPVSVPTHENFTQSALHHTDRGIVIGALPSAAHNDPSLAAVHFDTVLIDDAERVTLPEAIAAMLMAPRYILFGDPEGPSPKVYGTYAPRSPAAQSALSFFSRLAPGTSLEASFHLNDQLAEFPSKNFYKRRLRAWPAHAGRRIALQKQPPWPRFQEVFDPEHSAVFVETQHEGCDMRSEEEAKVAAWLTAVLVLGCDFPAEQVAVISPYRAQARLIRDGVVELAESRGAPFPEQILFGAPEDLRVQGRDVVILSLATSDFRHAFARGDDTFSVARLNLALTRAAVKRIVIGSPYLLTATPPDLSMAGWLTLVRQLAEESKRVPLKVRT
ncbi:MAG: DEAD/DEAH box helicase [Anaerolineae bacterium]|nr:DEAD/DEAH box helicase [Anaerolineae bacterium]